MGPLSRLGQQPPTFGWPKPPPRGPWYGSSLTFTGPLEAETRRRLHERLHVQMGLGSLRYTVRGLRHSGDPHQHEITVVFEADPWLPTFSLPPEEFPRVYADPGQPGPHRHVDDALCLWDPSDPRHMRWTPDKGLHDLLGLAVQHLFAEYWWREHNEWLLTEAPHDPGASTVRKRPTPTGLRQRRAA